MFNLGITHQHKTTNQRFVDKGCKKRNSHMYFLYVEGKRLQRFCNLDGGLLGNHIEKHREDYRDIPS